MEFILELLGGLIWISCFSLFLASGIASFRFIKSQRPYNEFNLPPISILKPCKGCDRGFRENIETFFQLEYPEYEIIFAVADKKDPAIKIIQSVIKRYPHITAKLIIGDVKIGANPKVNNLVKPLHSARFEHIVISDSNIRVQPSYLTSMATELRAGVGLVSSPVVGFKGKGLGGVVEEVFLNTAVLRWLLLLSWLDKSIPLGKSMLLTKSTLAKIGGLKSLGSYIAEDYRAGFAVRQLGQRVVTAREPIYQFIGQHPLSQYWSRHLRWGRIRKVQTPLLFLFEPLGNALLSGAVGALSIGGSYWLEFLLCHLAVWFSIDALLVNQVYKRDGWNFILPWVVRECLALPHWIHAALRNSIRWRDQSLVLSRGGLIK